MGSPARLESRARHASSETTVFCHQAASRGALRLAYVSGDLARGRERAEDQCLRALRLVTNNNNVETTTTLIENRDETKQKRETYKRHTRKT